MGMRGRTVSILWRLPIVGECKPIVVLTFHTALVGACRPGAALPKAEPDIILRVAPVWRRAGLAGRFSEAFSLRRARKAFRIQNSWGRGFGDGGYAWLSCEFWTRNVGAGYVID